MILLLAVLCIGGVELAVCRLADPELFYRVTAPVRYAAHSARESVATALFAVLPSSPSQDGEEPEEQMAEEPELQDTLTLSDPAITELAVRGQREVLTGGTVEITYFNQGEEPWANQKFGQDPIDKYGCGPTAMAMVVSSLRGLETDPAQMAEWAYDHGYWASKSGSYLSIVEGTAEAYGLHVESCPEISAEALREALSTDNVAVALMTSGHFTKKGHFILLRGTTLDGDILVADPNSRDRSLVAWDAQLILDELSKSRGFGAPLWLFSTADAPQGP